MDWDAISHFAVFASTLICTGSAIFMIVMRSSFASKEEVTKLGTRVTIIEQVAKPEWLNEVSKRLGEVEGDLKGIGVNIEGIKTTMDLHQDKLTSIETYLLEHDR